VALPRDGSSVRSVSTVLSFREPRGSHRIYRHTDGRGVVVAYHHLSDSFPIGTLKAMIADAGWDEDDLRRLGLI